MKFAEAKEYLESKLSTLPIGWYSVVHDTNICDGITLRWSVEAKEDWSHKIFQNTTGGIVFIHVNSRDGREASLGDSERVYNTDYTNWTRKVKFRRAKNNDLKKLCDGIVSQMVKNVESL